MDMKSLWQENFMIYFTHHVNNETVIEPIHHPRVCLAKDPWVFLLKKGLHKLWAVLEPMMWADMYLQS